MFELLGCATCMHAISIVLKFVFLQEICIAQCKGPIFADIWNWADAEGLSSGELSPNEEFSGFTVDHATTTYYEFHSNVACTSDVGVRRFFDEEVVGDCVSDYRIYDDNVLDIAHIRHIILPKTTKKERFQAASKCCMDILLAMATIGIL